MKKTALALAAVAILAAGAVAAPTPADARSGRVAAGVIGGLAAGAIIGGALSQPRTYGPGYSYGYYAASPAPCRIERQRVWDGFAWRVQRVEVCY